MQRTLSVSIASALFTFACTTLVAATASAQAPASATPAAIPVDRPMVELAVCLDISGSMDGLIESAKARLWSIVNDLATAKPVPQLRVALLTYGCDAYDSSTGWVVVDADLTEDLDLISQKLFSLKTNGGTEFVGRVVDKAAKSLAWSTDPNALRVIVVAGNEGADQDIEVTYQNASRASIERGIVVNSIYCGAATDPIAAAWGEVARLADGQFLCIDQTMGAVVAETPFDKQLTELSGTINSTYLACGVQGQEKWANQTVQDRNAQSLSGGVAAQRAASKGSAIYDNRAWDIVDGCAAGSMKLEEIKDEDLPEEMRGKTIEQKKSIVEAKQVERTRIQKEIQALQAQRDAYLADAARKQATTQGVALDDALKQAIRSQATKKGMQFAPVPPVRPAPASGTTATAPTTETSQSKN